MNKTEEYKMLINKQKFENNKLSKRISNSKVELEKINEQEVEAKMKRIAMQEIMQSSFEKLCRSSGIVHSFYNPNSSQKK
ncbi:hypothetical protein [Lactococcus lactis]|uniref:hypothetical protein n=1 Tax=Lactococcus lactis TaxID=1358 RepID=UPI00345D3B6D